MSIQMSRQEYEKSESDCLATFALKNIDSKGRVYPEEEHPIRSAFQRDRDRIIHCRAFRRLEYKTQVFVNHEGDHYRTRLTHTMEVAQIGRNIARALRLNEDLTEAIALAHDVGHPPFGHSGEKALNTMMKDFGGFEHNCQSLRIVEKLEKRYPQFEGLNLTNEVREGMQKHSGHYSSLEAQVADVSDDIAYLCHDLDDGLSSGLLFEKDLESVNLWMRIHKDIHRDYQQEDREVLNCYTVRSLINYLVISLLEETKNRIEKYKIKSVDDVQSASSKIVTFNKEMSKEVLRLREFLFKNLYNHPQVEKMNQKAQSVVKGLFNFYTKRTDLLQPSTQKKLQKRELKQVICDYIAGMTDRFALKEHQRLLESEDHID